MAERQLARDEERNALRTYEPAALRMGGLEVVRAPGKRRATHSGHQAAVPLSAVAGGILLHARMAFG